MASNVLSGVDPEHLRPILVTIIVGGALFTTAVRLVRLGIDHAERLTPSPQGTDWQGGWGGSDEVFGSAPADIVRAEGRGGDA